MIHCNFISTFLHRNSYASSGCCGYVKLELHSGHKEFNKAALPYQKAQIENGYSQALKYNPTRNTTQKNRSREREIIWYNTELGNSMLVLCNWGECHVVCNMAWWCDSILKIVTNPHSHLQTHAYITRLWFHMLGQYNIHLFSYMWLKLAHMPLRPRCHESNQLKWIHSFCMHFIKITETRCNMLHKP